MAGVFYGLSLLGGYASAPLAVHWQARAHHHRLRGPGPGPGPGSRPSSSCSRTYLSSAADSAGAARLRSPPQPVWWVTTGKPSCVIHTHAVRLSVARDEQRLRKSPSRLLTPAAAPCQWGRCSAASGALCHAEGRGGHWHRGQWHVSPPRRSPSSCCSSDARSAQSRLGEPRPTPG